MWRQSKRTQEKAVARITVEDCLANIPNRFELVLLGAHRARELCTAAEATVPLDRDKPTVLALKELASGSISQERLRESLVARIQRPLADEPDEILDDDAFNIDRMAEGFADTFRMAGDAGSPSCGSWADDESADHVTEPPQVV